MTKQEFIKRISRQTRLPQKHVSDVLNASHRLLEDILRTGDKVAFPGFGTFYASQRKAEGEGYPNREDRRVCGAEGRSLPGRGVPQARGSR